jgi:hypothetical protein
MVGLGKINQEETMEEQLKAMIASYQQSLADEQLQRIQAQVLLEQANQRVARLEAQLHEAQEETNKDEAK